MLNPRITYLLNRFHAKNISAEEHDELMQFMADEHNRQQAEDFLKKAWDEFEPVASPLTSQKSDAILEAILNNDTEQPAAEQYKARLIYWPAVRWAAAAVVLLSSAIVFYRYWASANKPSVIASSNQVKQPKADIAPGGNRAVLILGNHKKINLDDVASGVLARQENISIHKTRDGQLVYKVTGSNSHPSGAITSAQYNTLSTPAGGQYNIELPDGSKVWLNASSSLRFPSAFSGNERRVELSGEAYFEVAKNKRLPFHVVTSQADVEVLGTHFNISAYSDDHVYKATLLEGSVRVSKAEHSQIIKPGEQARIADNASAIRVAQVDTEEAVAWKNGYFMFADEDIHSIMQKISRWYGADVEYENPDIQETFGGTISKYKNLSEVLKVLGETGTIHFKIIPGAAAGNGRRIIVMK